MMRMSRLLPVLGASSLIAVWFLCGSPVLAQDDTAKPATPAVKPPAAKPKPAEGGDAAAPAAPAAPTTPAAPAATAPAAPAAPETPAPAPADTTPAPAAATPLLGSVEDFWHYALTARYDQAAAVGNKILGGSDSAADLYNAFLAIASERNTDPIERLLTWQTIPAMKDVCTKLVAKLHDGVKEILTTPDYIKKQIERLSVNNRAYMLGFEELRRVGELCVPFMVDYLRHPEQKQHHAAIRQALVDMGRGVLNPLVAATETSDHELLIILVDILGGIGYDSSIPYLHRIAANKDLGPEVNAAAVKAIRKIASVDPASLNAGKLFYDLAEKFYYNTCSITFDKRVPTAGVWNWDDAKGLSKADVPPAIFNYVMAMRSCEYALKANPELGDAISLWLTANYKREATLADGQADPSRPDGQPNAHFFGVAAGTRYLSQVVTRAAKDRDSLVVLKAVKSLGAIAGHGNLYSGEYEPVIDALRYPDRLVRFEAAMALAASLPQKPFAGRERVVPVLADALLQSGKPCALVAAASQDELNKLVEAVKGAGFQAAGGVTPEATMANLSSMPGVDVIIISEKIDVPSLDRLLKIISLNARVERVPRLFVVASMYSPYASRALDDSLTNVVTSIEPAKLTAAIQASRSRSGSLPLDEKLATDYALRSADLLYKLTIGHSPVFDSIIAAPNLLAALEDTRVEVSKAAAHVLGVLDLPEAQSTLLGKALEDKVGDEVKIVFLKSAATSAKAFGNRLTSQQLDALQKLVESAPNVEVRIAAAELRGALNLAPAQDYKLVTNQSRVPSVHPKE